MTDFILDVDLEKSLERVPSSHPVRARQAKAARAGPASSSRTDRYRHTTATSRGSRLCPSFLQQTSTPPIHSRRRWRDQTATQISPHRRGGSGGSGRLGKKKTDFSETKWTWQTRSSNPCISGWMRSLSRARSATSRETLQMEVSDDANAHLLAREPPKRTRMLCRFFFFFFLFCFFFPFVLKPRSRSSLESHRRATHT